MPVADVEDLEPPGILCSCPVHELGHRSRLRLRSEQTEGLCVAHVQEIREGIVGADRVDEVPLKTLCDEQGLLGTMLVAAEGFNGTLAGSEESVRTVMNWIREQLGITEELDARWTDAVDAPFRRMRVKVKTEIVRKESTRYARYSL